MKNHLLFVLFLSFSTVSFSQQQDITGVWLTGEKGAHIKIYEIDGTYHGKIVWVKDKLDPETGKPWVDRKNPDASKHQVPILGLTILENFTLENESLDNGTIYNSKDGKTYDGKLWLENENELNVRGYIGFLYSTQTWTRVQEP